MDKNQIRISTGADVVELLPMMMSYEPTERVVVAYLASGRIVCTAALELAALRSAWQGLETPVATTRADRLVMVGYTAAPEQWAGAVGALVERLGLPCDAYMATPSSWAPLRVGVEGVMLGEDKPRTATTAVVEAVVAGLTSPARSRAEAIAPAMPDELHAAELATTQPQEWNGEAVTDMLAELASGAEQMTAPTVRALAAALIAPDAFDAWATGMTTQQAEREMPQWMQAASYYTDRPASARIDMEAERVLVALGLTGWLAGNGMVHVAALDRLDRRTKAGCIPSEDAMLEVALLRMAHEMAVRPSDWLGYSR